MKPEYLQTDEAALAQTGRHPVSILDQVLLGSLPFIAAIVGVAVLWFTQDLPRWGSIGLPLCLALGVLWIVFLLTRYWRVRTSSYTVTASRVYKAYGLLRFTLQQTTYDKVTDMHVRQSLFGRIWGFGTVRVETAGSGIALEGVRDPFAFKRTIEDNRHAFLGHLVRSFSGKGAQSKRIAVPKPAVELWQGTPTPSSFVGALMGIAPLLFISVGLLIAGLVADPWFLAGAGGVLLLLSLVILNLWIRLRYTRYHIESRGVVVTSGWLSRRRVETTFDKVTDVAVFQGVLARILNYGTITINTAGGNQAPVIFHGLRDPEQIKSRIDEARQ